MSHYTRGAAFERKVKKYYEDQGWFCVRAAGSHGVADIVAIRRSVNSGGYSYTDVHLVSCRINAKWNGNEWQQLRKTANEIFAYPILAYRTKNNPLQIDMCPPWNQRGKPKPF